MPQTLYERGALVFLYTVIVLTPSANTFPKIAHVFKANGAVSRVFVSRVQ